MIKTENNTKLSSNTSSEQSFGDICIDENEIHKIKNNKEQTKKINKLHSLKRLKLIIRKADNKLSDLSKVSYYGNNNQ